MVLLLPHQLGGLEFTTAGAAAPLQRLRRCIAATVAAFEAEVGWQDHLLPAFAAPAEVDGDSAASIGINSNHNTAAPVERFAVAGAEAMRHHLRADGEGCDWGDSRGRRLPGCVLSLWPFSRSDTLVGIDMKRFPRYQNIKSNSGIPASKLFLAGAGF